MKFFACIKLLYHLPSLIIPRKTVPGERKIKHVLEKYQGHNKKPRTITDINLEPMPCEI